MLLDKPLRKNYIINNLLFGDLLIIEPHRLPIIQAFTNLPVRRWVFRLVHKETYRSGMDVNCLYTKTIYQGILQSPAECADSKETYPAYDGRAHRF